VVLHGNLALGVLAKGTGRELGDAAEGDVEFGKQFGEGVVPHRIPLLSMIGVDFWPDIDRLCAALGCLRENRLQGKRPIKAGSQ
jgi:hypothetical protein